MLLDNIKWIIKKWACCFKYLASICFSTNYTNANLKLHLYSSIIEESLKKLNKFKKNGLKKNPKEFEISIF